MRTLLEYVQARSGFYQNLFKVNAIDVDKITGIAQLKHIPPTTKRDLQLYNNDFLCVPPQQILEYTTTSGTLGAPVVVALTGHDLQRLAYNELLTYEAMNVTQDDVVQLALTLDKQFMAGMAYYQGAHLLHAAVIRTGPGVPSMQWDTIFRMRTTVLVAVPSFILKLLEYAEQNGVDYRASPVRKILCIGENIRRDDLSLNVIGERIKRQWDVELFSTYASTEMQTAFTECTCGAGGHIHPDLLLAEVLDEYGNTVAAGDTGELVITTLGVEGMPLVRYRTNDLCRLMDEPCRCGRVAPRISPIVGRKGQMIKFKGTTLYPPMIFEVLNACEDILDYVVEVTANELETDDIVLHLALRPDDDDHTDRINSFLHAALRVRPRIVIHPIDAIRAMQLSETSRKLTRILYNNKK